MYSQSQDSDNRYQAYNQEDKKKKRSEVRNKAEIRIRMERKSIAKQRTGARKGVLFNNQTMHGRTRPL